MAEKTPSNPSRRPKRVSLKGRGADIFFGDYTPPGLEVPPEPAVKPSPQHDSIPSSKYDIEQSSQHDSLIVKQHDSETSHHHDSMLSADGGEAAPGRSAAAPSQPDTPTEAAAVRTPASQPARRERRSATSAATPPAAVSTTGARALPSAELPPEVWAQLDETATIANTFRYTEDEVAALNDALYQIGKEHKVRVTKQDAVRLGLNLVLEDYRRRGLESLLGQLAENRQQLRRTGGH